MSLVFIFSFLLFFKSTIPDNTEKIPKNWFGINVKPPISGPTTYASYQNKIVCYTSESIRNTQNVGEVVSIINEAIRKKVKVKAFGARHSETDIICTSGIAMDMRAINYMEIEQITGLAKVGAGAYLKDFLDFLDKNGRGLAQMPSYSGITIGGGISAGVHGSTLLHPSTLSDQVTGMTIVDGNGNIRIITNAGELRALRVHLGLLGIIIDVTFSTIPQYKVQMRNYPDSDIILENGEAIEIARNYDHAEIWWFPSTRSVVVSRGSNIPEDRPGDARAQLMAEWEPEYVYLIKRSLEIIQGSSENIKEFGLGAFEEWTRKSLYMKVPGRSEFFSQDLVNGPSVGKSHLIMTNRCENCTWSFPYGKSLYQTIYSLAVDLDKWPDVIQTMKNLIHLSPEGSIKFPLIGIYIRFAKESDATMAIENGRKETVHIEWLSAIRDDPFEDSSAYLGTYHALAKELILKHDARSHWSKTGLYYLTQPFLKNNYAQGNLEIFKFWLREFDPNGIFMNPFGYRLLELDNKLILDPRVRHCALQNYCECSNNDDCSNKQYCGQIAGHRSCLNLDNIWGKLVIDIERK